MKFVRSEGKRKRAEVEKTSKEKDVSSLQKEWNDSKLRFGDKAHDLLIYK